MPAIDSTSTKIGDIVGMGASCFASVYHDQTVLKGYEIWLQGQRVSYYPRTCEEALRREQEIYKHLGQHPQIVRCFGLIQVHEGVSSLRLERAPYGNVRQYIEANEPLSEPQRLRMALDVALGIRHIHLQEVQHSDLSCRNFFLFDDFRVKIGDFGSSFMQKSTLQRTICEESRYELPCRGRKFDDRPIVQREIFALGSAIYEIMYWSRPFAGMEEKEVEERYAREEFPLVSGRVGDIIMNCWKEVYKTADEAVTSLQGLVDSQHQ